MQQRSSSANLELGRNIIRISSIRSKSLANLLDENARPTLDTAKVHQGTRAPNVLLITPTLHNGWSVLLTKCLAQNARAVVGVAHLFPRKRQPPPPQSFRLPALFSPGLAALI